MSRSVSLVLKIRQGRKTKAIGRKVLLAADDPTSNLRAAKELFYLITKEIEGPVERKPSSD
ncbi:MAG: hypothetical protein EBU46_15915 [Nitrosomonadaceae bacterium]|nr:hypothetical protein [Nitrosomonadaceae bacterium]